MTAPADKAGNGSNTSVHPGWRKAIVSVSATGADNLRKFAPDMGVYQNEAKHDEPDWKEAFWGLNYAKLSQIKTKYDPKGIFWVTPGVNADKMHVVDGRVCKVDKEPSSASRVAPLNDAQTEADLSNPVSLFGKLELTGLSPPPNTLMGFQEN